MTDLRERLALHAVPFLACMHQCSTDDAWNSPNHWQTFDDEKNRKDKSLASHWSETIEDAAEKLERLNREGAGVFVTVNSTDGKGRKKSNIHLIRGHHVDLDQKDASESFDIARLPLPPTMAVRTPGGWHLYWLAREPMPCDGEARWEEHEAELKAIQVILAPFGADPNACTVERVLRVPGFMHRKGDPRLVELVTVNGPYYRREEICAAFPPMFRQAEKEVSPTPEGDRTEVKVRAGAYLASLPGAVEGSNGSGVTFSAALKIITRFNLSQPEALDLMKTIHNPQCRPGWSEKELQHKVADAWKVAQESPDLGCGCAGKDEWPAPQPLASKVESAHYPVDALPPTIQAAVKEVHGFVKSPVALVASSAIGAVSLATQGHWDMMRAERLSGPIGLYMLTIGDSGERKSTSDGFFTTSINTYEALEEEEGKPRLQNYRADMAAWEAGKSGLKDAIRARAKAGKPSCDLEKKMRDLEQRKPEEPRIPRLLYADATPEALKWSLAKHWPSAGIVSSEAGVVFGAHGMSNDSLMRNLSTLNQLWDGAAIQTERRSSESFTVRGARLTISLQVQEATLRTFLDQAGALARGSGFLARFLVAWPESTQGFRLFTEAPAAWPHLERFNRRIASILANPLTVDEDGALSPGMLTFTSEAKVAWIAFHDRVERELCDGGQLRDVRDVASKIADNAARMAALFHVFESAAGEAVGIESFEAARRITEWHLNEARRFFGELALPEGLANAARLESWIVERCNRLGVDRIPTQEVQQLGPNGLREKAVIDTAMKELEDLGRAQRLHEGKRKFIAVNPALLGSRNSGNSSSRNPLPESNGLRPSDGETNGSKNSDNSSSAPVMPMGGTPFEARVSGADWDDSIPVEV